MRRLIFIFSVACVLTLCSLAPVPASDVPGLHVLTPTSAAAQSGDADQLMLDGPVGELPVVDDARWSSAVTDNSLVALIWWSIILAGFFLAGLPWTKLLFPRLGAPAAGLARLIAWLGAAWLVWILASLEVIAFRAVWSVCALILVAAVGWFWLLKASPASVSRSPIRQSIGGPEIAFWLVFAIFLVFRWINPDSWHPAWGGEKPMEFAHINAILRSAHFPPFDPWFSGGILNYYYYGGYLVAFLCKVTGIPSEIAFNLAQPTIMALLASAVYTVSSSIAGAARSKNASSIGGWVGVIVVLFMGNLISAKRALELLPELPQPSFVEWTWNPSRAIEGAITEFPYFTGLYADLHAHVVALPITVLVIAGCLELAKSADIPDAAPTAEARQFHVPLLLLLALSMGTLSATNAWDVPLYAALIAAAIWMTFESAMHPARSLAMTIASLVFAVLGAALMFLPFHQHYVALFSSVDEVRGPTRPDEWLLHLGGLLVLCGIGIVWMAVKRPLTWVDASPRRQRVLVLGSVIATVTLAIYVALRLESFPVEGFSAAVVAVITILLAGWYVESRSRPILLLSLAGLIAFASVAVIVWSGWSVLAAGVGIALLGATLWIWPAAAETRFAGLLIAAAGCAVAGLELLFVVDDLAPDPVFYRMNTMFKVYNEIWILLGIAGASLASRVIAAALDDRFETDQAFAQRSDCSEDFCEDQYPARRVRLEIPLTIVTALVIAVGAVYPLLATGPRLEERFDNHASLGTLNALDWMDDGVLVSPAGETITFAGDRAAIDWFNHDVPGTPVIAEASIGPYRGNGSRISIGTGLPTVIGWYRHERQQRYRPELDARMIDIQALYNASDSLQVQELIDRYGIEYIVVGDVERHTIVDEATGRTFASPEGLATFESMIGSSLKIAFDERGTVVYQVVGS